MQALEGKCPDAACGNVVYFLSPAPDNKVECIKCKQFHEESALLDKKPVSKSSFLGFLQNIQKLKAEQIKKKTESLRVKGLSNYSCKLISPLLTKYGLDKSTQEVKLLCTMGQGDAFDCSNLSNRAFTIEPENLHIPEYGRDESVEYLQDTLKEISYVNDNEERLVPIYADGDGHCLLHAISRALIGRELFWHPLLTNLKEHFIKRQSDYKALLGDFIQDSEWNDIIKEADPNYLPAYGETHGLRNIHVFGLANVLHRPIILIDSLEGMRSKGDYSAIFLPALIPLDKCKGADGILNKPIVIAWSSKGHNHFVPLVGIRGKPIPKYPSGVLPKVWGLSQDLLFRYVEFKNGTCVIGGSKTLSDTYLKKLLDAMSNHYLILNGVAPSVVADCYQHIYKPSGVVGMTAQMITEAAHALVKEERLYRCLACSTVTQQELPCPISWLEPGGKLYDVALKTQGTLKAGCHYKIPHNNTSIVCSYDKTKNKLLLVQDVSTLKCKHCAGSIRLVKRDSKVVYFNGDQLPTPASSSSHCGCGFKHYWEEKEYDNLPNIIPVKFEWNGVKKEDVVHWFQNESDTALNSNAFQLAQKVVHKHFPGEFGSERVVQKVVEQIFREALKYKPLEQKPPTSSASSSASPPPPPRSTTPSKIILTGAKSKTIHKEELTASKKEQILCKKIEHGAALKQKRLSSSPIKHTNIDTSPSKIVNIDTSSNKTAADLSPSNKQALKPVDKVHRVRISTAEHGSLMFTLTEKTSFDDIQSFVEEKFNIRRDVQVIKYGFPLKTLQPSGGDSSAPLNLKHGERLMVHVMKRVVQSATPMEVDGVKDPVLVNKTTSNSNSGNTTTTALRDASSLPTSRNDENVSVNSFGTGNIHTVKDYDIPRSPNGTTNNEAVDDNSYLTSSLFSLLEKVDLWPWACTQRPMFKTGGLFYMQASNDLNGMVDGQHFSLPCFPNKLFVFKAQADEVYLCLGDQHIPVQTLSQEQEQIAHKQVQGAALNKLNAPLPHKIIFPKQGKEMDTASEVDKFDDEKLCKNEGGDDDNDREIPERSKTCDTDEQCSNNDKNCDIRNGDEDTSSENIACLQNNVPLNSSVESCEIVNNTTDTIDVDDDT